MYLNKKKKHFHWTTQKHINSLNQLSTEGIFNAEQQGKKKEKNISSNIITNYNKTMTDNRFRF